MRLTTWCGSTIETNERPWSHIAKWALGWVRLGWTSLGRQLRREARQ